MEVLLAAASQPEPPPMTELVGPQLQACLLDDLTDLLALLRRADLSLQDEVEFVLHPTLTRLWALKGRRNQRLVEAPGSNEKLHGFGLMDWRDGWMHTLLAPGRTAQPFCDQLDAAVARSETRERIAMVLCGNARTHTPEGSLMVRALLAKHGGNLVLVYTPKYDPEANRIEWLWRMSRKQVTHNHQRRRIENPIEDAKSHFQWRRENPQEVLRHIGSPYAPDDNSIAPQDLAV